MAIKHTVVKAPGQKLFAVADWNADHTFLQTDIDHNQITNTHNLTVDIDHNTITNTHNLTIDIDHNLLTNYAANRHFLESEISHLNILNIGTNTHAQIDTHISSLAGNHIPPGVIEMYGAAAAPTGWLLCNGAAVSRTTYAALFAVISETYGVGDGSTTFNVPNFASKFPRGNTAGATGGSDDAINVSHTHTFTGNAMGTHGHADTLAFSGNLMGTHGHGDNFTTANQSASHTHSHTHGAIASGIQSASHTHTTTIGSHSHNVRTYSEGGTGSIGAAGGTITGAGGQTYTTTVEQQAYQRDEGRNEVWPLFTDSHNYGDKTSGNQSADHIHSTTIPAKNSGTQSASHNHTINGAVTAASAGTPAGSITGAVTAASAGTPAGTNSTEGVSGVNANIPAYLGVNFIIKY